MTNCRPCALFAVTFFALLIGGCRSDRPPSTGESRASDDEGQTVATPMLLEVSERHELGLAQARGLAVDLDGRLLVAYDEGVVRLDGQMQPAQRWATPGPAVAVVVDTQGRLLVAELTRVHVFGPDGEHAGSWSGPRRAASPAVGQDSAAEQGAGQGTQTGQNPLAEQTGQDSQGDGFVAITALAADGDFVRIADAGARAIFRYDLTGEYADMVGGRDPATGISQIICPSPFLGMAMGQSGELVIGNPGKHRIEYYDRNNKLIRHWGRGGESPEHFPGCCNPTNVATTPGGLVVVSEKGMPRVKVYGSNGDLMGWVGTEHFGAGAQGISLALGKGGEIYALDPSTSTLLVLTLRERVRNGSGRAGSGAAAPAHN